MKKLLILAYDFPPYVSVGGLRPLSWYKYLHEYNVYPIVVTRQWSNKNANYLDYISQSGSDKIIVEELPTGTIIRTPYSPNLANKIMLKYGESRYKLIRKSISAFYEFAQFFFLIGPKVSIYFAADKYLKNHKVDAIIATGDPFILFKYASKLGKKHTTPWIADYRDPWSQKLQIQKNILLKFWHSFFERKIVRTCTLITTVSELIKVKILNTVKNKDIIILPNGFDPDFLERVKDIKQQSDSLLIGYAGTIYKWHPIRSFMSVISKFIELKGPVRVQLNLYGINMIDEIKEILNSYPNLKAHVNIFPKMPNDLMLKELAKNNLLLLLNNYSYMGTKIYDYIGVKRKIILCYENDQEAKNLKTKYFDMKETFGISNNLQEEIIKKTNSGYVIQDSKHLMKVLEDLYSEFIKQGFIECNTINAEDYSRKEQVKKLAEIIKRIS